MTISNHARQRMKERCGFNRKTQDRMARKAFDEGGNPQTDERQIE